MARPLRIQYEDAVYHVHLSLREIPAVRRLKKYTAKEEIIAALCKETKKRGYRVKPNLLTLA
ncbi:MAG: hypothetical protein FJ264_04420 [Planctomycetes bacterium]|nr:hypothetical protein [Planctomycetota bacterium]